MPYEIPQNLQYKEKIMFGLTFEQLIYLGIFGGTAAAILLKTNLILEIKLILAAILGSLGAGFAFFNLQQMTNNLYSYFKGIRKAGYFDPKLDKFVEARKIKNDLIYLPDNSVRAILQVQPINFSTLSTNEKNAITQAYKDFLNSLDFPIQITVRTTNLNLEQYFDNIKAKTKSEEKHIEKHVSDFQNFLDQYIQENTVRNRLFYITIPYNPHQDNNPLNQLLSTFSRNKTELSEEAIQNRINTRIELCREKLQACGLKTKRLLTNEIVSLLANFFEGYIETDQDYLAPYTSLTNEKRLISDQYFPNPGAQLVSIIKPEYVDNSFDSIKINNQLNRVISVNGYPRIIQEGWLSRLIVQEGEFNLSLFIQPASIETIMENLNKELIKQKSDLLASEKQGITTPSLELQYEDTYKTLTELQKGSQKLFKLSFYINTKGNNREELDLQTKKTASNLNSIMLVPKIAYFRQQQALQSCLPLSRDKLKIQKDLTSDALAACFPFTNSFLETQTEGTIIGLNKTNNIPIILDPYKLANQNGLCIGCSGSGKSYAIKTYIMRNLMKGTKTFIIDPQGEYTDLTKAYKGQLIEISRYSDSIINPFDLMQQDYGEKILSLLDLFQIMMPDLTEVQKGILDKAVNKIYSDRGIKPNEPETWQKTPPTIGNLYEHIITLRTLVSQRQRTSYDALENRLRIFAEGSFSFMNKQTHLDFSKNLITFNISEMPNQIKPTIMFLILDYIVKKMYSDRQQKLLVFDEAWTLLRHATHSEYLLNIVKTSRKFGLSMVLINQQADELIDSTAGKAILANTAWKLLLRQESSVIEQLAQTFNLNQEEKNQLLTAMPGEGILLAMNDHTPIKIIASQEEHKLITTKPEEQTEKKTQIQVDKWQPTKTFYKKNGLTENQVKELLDTGYIESRQPDFQQGRGSIYLIKPPKTNQSLEHWFMTNLTAEEVRKYTDTVQLYDTVGPDIEFTANNKKIAIEIETGVQVRDIKSLTNKQTELSNGYEKYFIIVTDRTKAEEYRKYGTTIIRTEIKDTIKQIFQKNTNSLQTKTPDLPQQLK